MLHNKKSPSAQSLLKWYDQHGRQMPWRALPNKAANPYHVWLSEIMLQQTTVVTVKPYFEKFIKHWPTIIDLSKASEDDVLTQWAGLGYYSRARNLYKTAQIIAGQYKGIFPSDIKSLKELPGVGDYTANAVRSIAFNKPATVVDGNVERVISRIFTIETPLPKAKKEITVQAEKITSQKRSGDYSQAIMDLGATICTPKSPKCSLCPWVKNCVAYSQKTQGKYPVKLPKKNRLKRFTTAFVFVDDQDHVFLRRRAKKGLLAGMMEVPSTEWVKDKPENIDDISFLKKNKAYKPLTNLVRHVFTHFELVVSVVVLPKYYLKNTEGIWVKMADLNNQALPTLMKKIIKQGVSSLDDSSIQNNKIVVK